MFPEDTPQHPRHTRIDPLLNKYRNSPGGHAAYKACVAAIQKNLGHVPGFEKTQAGSSEPDSDDDDDNNNLLAIPVVATSYSGISTAIPKPPENHPIGRPIGPPSNDAG
jgi:hypothetical protein